MRKFIAFALLISSQAYSAAPVISAANLSGSTLTISGSNFGSKSTAAPFLFPDIAAQSNGTLATAIGFDQWNQSNHPTLKYTVNATAGVGSSKSLYLQIPADLGDATSGTVINFGALLPAPNNKEVFASYWFKYHRVSDARSHTGASQTQWKILRAGTGTSSDGNDNYNGTDGKYYPSVYIDITGQVFAGYQRDYRNTAGGQLPSNSQGQYNRVTDPSFSGDVWNNIEVYYKYNTFSGATPNTDGIERLVWNGVTIYDTVSPQPGESAYAANQQHPATTSSEDLGFILLMAGPEYMDFWDYDTYVSRPYIDTTQARAFVCDSATLASCTGRFILPATAWASGAISASTAGTIPSGYNYLYVVNSAGEVNSTGFTYSTGGGTDTPISPSPPTLIITGATPTFTRTANIAIAPAAATLRITTATSTFTNSTPSTNTYQFIRRPARPIIRSISRSVGR